MQNHFKQGILNKSMEKEMNLKAKPIVDGKFWIVEDDGERIATLHKKENNKFMLSSKDGEAYFNKKDDLIKHFGKDFFQSKVKSIVVGTQDKDVHTFPAACKPYNAMYDVQRKLPLYTKSLQSKSLYCAGYYAIQFNKGWVKSFCPKLITVERYAYKGPFRTELELKQVLSNVKPD